MAKTIANPHYRDTAHNRATDQSLAAAVLGLIFFAVPALSVVAPSASDALAIGASLFAAIPIATRLNQTPRLSWAVLAFIGAYALSAYTHGQMGGQGGTHVFTTFAAGSALLLFATYGKDMLAYQLFNQLASVVIVAGLLVVDFSDAPKNIAGGTMLYLGALLTMLAIVNKPGRSWAYSRTFLIGTVALALLLDFRSLVGFAAVLMVGYLGGTRMTGRRFWLAGIVAMSAFNAVMIWYFLHIYTDPRAVAISNWIAEKSGRRAASGRDFLWPAIINRVHDYRLFGLGAGELPRDFLPTTLSSHSHYFQVYLQLGLVGLALLIFVLLSVWKYLAAAETPPARFGAAIFLMFVAHNSTEVLMFQNGLMAGIPAWCAIGLAVSLARAERAPG